MTIKELLSDRNKWTQGHAAKDKNGQACVGAADPRAVCWCVLGATQLCYPGAGREYKEAYDKLIKASLELFGTALMTHVNDILGYEAVMKVVEAAGV